MTKALVVSVATLGIWIGSSAVVGSGVAAAETCGSATACARYVVCLSGSNKLKSGLSYACEKKSKPKTATPRCSRLNSVNDWRWDRSGRVCYRKRNNGQRVESKSNIECGSGFRYKSSSGLCEKSASTSYYRNQLSKSSTGSFVPQNASSRTAASQTVGCAGGYKLQTLSTDRFACKKTVVTAEKDPTCKRLNSRNDWRWDRAGRVCFRKRNNGQRIESDQNITCEPGFDYDRRKGVCHRPGGVVYAVPTLK